MKNYITILVLLLSINLNATTPYWGLVLKNSSLKNDLRITTSSNNMNRKFLEITTLNSNFKFNLKSSGQIIIKLENGCIFIVSNYNIVYDVLMKSEVLVYLVTKELKENISESKIESITFRPLTGIDITYN
jgi:predicted transcriptional regulator YheO